MKMMNKQMTTDQEAIYLKKDNHQMQINIMIFKKQYLFKNVKFKQQICAKVVFLDF